MKRCISLFIGALFAASFALAQQTVEFDLKPDEQTQKEIVLKGPLPTDELRIMMGIKWFEMDHRIQLVFDRKTLNDIDDPLLLFPFYEHKEGIKGVKDCKSHKKLLWTKIKDSDLSNMAYFLKSDHLTINDYKHCYRTLAKNNEEEFFYDLSVVEHEFSIQLNGLFVIKHERRPWFYFSSRDKKILYKCDPVTLQIRLELRPEAAEVCEISAVVIPYVKRVHEIMLEDREELLSAQKSQSCTYFGLLKDKIRRMFVETNDKCEKYVDCEEIAAALKEYNDICLSLFDETCKSATVATASAACTLSETELSSINSRLKTLQMKINIKKKDGNSTAEEYKDYQSIITTVNPKLTQDCRKRYKNLIDAYTSYCTVIEGLF